MDDEKRKARIGANIAACRRSRGLTQAELAEKLRYTDKAVSKWERGDSVPDVLTMLDMAAVFGVPVSDLLDTGASAPGERAGAPRRRANPTVILLLSSVLVWFVALLSYVVVSSLRVPNSWVAFVYAVPVNAIVVLSIRSAWRQFQLHRLLISLIVWGCLASLYVSLLVFAEQNVWRILLLGIPGQIAVLLWFRLFPGKGKDNGQEPPAQ